MKPISEFTKQCLRINAWLKKIVNPVINKYLWPAKPVHSAGGIFFPSVFFNPIIPELTIKKIHIHPTVLTSDT